MIAPLRRRHRRIWLALCLLPIGVVAALIVDPPASLFESELLAALATEPIESSEVNESTVKIGEVEVRLKRSAASLLEIEPLAELASPDVLAYWTTAAADSGLPSGAYLLGSVDGRRSQVFPLPPASQVERGWLTLYSLAHGEVLGSGQLPANSAGLQP